MQFVGARSFRVCDSEMIARADQVGGGPHPTTPKVTSAAAAEKLGKARAQLARDGSSLLFKSWTGSKSESPALRPAIRALERRYNAVLARTEDDQLLLAGTRNAGGELPSAEHEHEHELWRAKYNVREAFQCYSDIRDAIATKASQAGQKLLPSNFLEHVIGSISACKIQMCCAGNASSELEQQLSVTCLEHGRILRRMHASCADSCTKLEALVDGCLAQLNLALRTIREQAERIQRSEDEKETVERIAHQKYRDEIVSLKRSLAEHIASSQTQAEAHAAQTRAQEATLSSLHGLFQHVQEVEAIKSADSVSSSESVSSLRKQLADAEKELDGLRPLRGQLRTAEGELARWRQRQSLKHRKSKATSRLRTPVVPLASHRADLVVPRTLVRKGSVLSDNSADMCESPLSSVPSLDDMSVGSSTDTQPRAQPEASAHCDGPRLDERGQSRQAASFEVLLPNLPDDAARRPLPWVRFCMRSIAFAYSKEVAVAPRTFLTPVSFPDFVFAFFEPAEQERTTDAVTCADKDRWGFFLGLKLLVREENLEAALFWTMLTEVNGGLEFARYYVHCLDAAAVQASAEACQRMGLSRDGREITTIRDVPMEVEDDQPGAQADVFIETSVLIGAGDTMLSKLSSSTRLRVSGITKTLARERAPGSNEKCVDLFLWMRVMMACFLKERGHRRNLLRLMFETAGAGSLLDSRPVYGSGAKTRHPEDEPAIDSSIRVNWPQFLAIVRTLHPRVGIAEASCLFRKSHRSDDSHGGARGADFLCFHQAAEESGFFVACLHLAPFLHCSRASSVDASGLSVAARRRLGADVHLNLQLLEPTLKQLRLRLPQNKLQEVDVAEGLLRSTLELCTDTASFAIDGLTPLAAYRRLANAVLHVKSICSEKGSAVLCTGDGAMKSELSAVQRIQRELGHIHALVSYDDGAALHKFNEFQTRVAAERIGSAIVKHVRRKAAFNQFLPLLKNSERVRRESRRLSMNLHKMVRRQSIAEE